MIFCLNIGITFIENGKPTNGPTSPTSPRELQVSESELGVQVPAWSQWRQSSAWTRFRGRKMTSKQNGHDSFLMSCLFPIFKAAVTSLSCPLHSPLTWHGFKSSHEIQWNPPWCFAKFSSKKTDLKTQQLQTPIFGFQDLSPSSTFSMSKGSWQWNSFCSGAKSHHYMTFTWLNQHTLVQIICVTGNVWLFSTFPGPPSRWFFPSDMTRRWRC